MSEDALAIVRVYFDEMWNRHDVAQMERFVRPDVRYHPPRGPPRDFEAYRQLALAFFEGFPDLRFDIEEAVEARGLVALRIRISGTHRGPWRGLAPTGRRMDVQGRPWLRVREGRVAEVWSLFDELGAMQQLGSVAENVARH